LGVFAGAAAIILFAWWKYKSSVKPTVVSQPSEKIGHLKEPPGHPCAAMHFWTPVAVSHFEQFVPSVRHTSVLLRCRVCGIHTNGIHPGDYVLEDFLRTEAPVQSLEGMVR
jgi:hypothetical protein